MLIPPVHRNKEAYPYYLNLLWVLSAMLG